MISGCCSASKNSGERRCPLRFSSATWTLCTFARPEISGLPEASLTRASNSLKLPRKVPTMCLTANPMLEWTGSDCQLPVGMVDSACAVVIECLLGEGYALLDLSNSLAENLSTQQLSTKTLQ